MTSVRVTPVASPASPNVLTRLKSDVQKQLLREHEKKKSRTTSSARRQKRPEEYSLEDQARLPPEVRIIGFFIEGRDDEKVTPRQVVEYPRKMEPTNSTLAASTELFHLALDESDSESEEQEPIGANLLEVSMTETEEDAPTFLEPTNTRVDPQEEERRRVREKQRLERQVLEKQRIEREQKLREEAERELKEKERLNRERERKEREGIEQFGATKTSVPMSLKDLTIIKKLGKGSFGEVKLVSHDANGAFYALKILDKKMLEKSHMVNTVIRERELHQKLSHGNIVRLLRTFQDQQKLYFLLEYCSNGDLFNLIKKCGKLEENAVIFLTAGLVNGLEYMHSQGVMHRDLKPENILLNETMQPKISDFGTARDLFSAPSDSDHSKPSSNAQPTTSHNAEPALVQQSTFTGTAEYLCPEMLQSSSGTLIGKGADLWALGCILFQMLVGRPPFKGSTDFMTFQKTLNRDFVLPSDLSVSAQDLINKLLDPDPKTRLGVASYVDLKNHPFFQTISDWGKIEPPKSLLELNH